MQIAVLGMGRFGSALARSLAGQDHEVLAIDQQQVEIQHIAPDVAKAAMADITDERALRELSVDKMDVAVVATGVLDASVLATMNLQALEVPRIYAKASSERHATILRRVGARRVVEPEKEGGERFAHLIRVAGATDYISLSQQYGIGLYSPPSRLVGQTLDEIEAEQTTRRLLILVRGDEVKLNPAASERIEAEDVLVFAGTDDDLAKDL
jgi:trk system potassium uptake protein TrkA